ncbi:MAG TPA: hypothetical protein VM097_13735 [Mycobacteriales bacterium]|nr:hypothetical protein [Mycobacteriales bacterium]
MKTRIAKQVAATALGALGLVVTGAGTAHAAAPANGCPNGYSLMSIDELAPQGYRVPGQVDDPSSGIRSFGEPGNGDGLVCAQAIGSRTTSWGGQLYQFWDNTLLA